MQVIILSVTLYDRQLTYLRCERVKQGLQKFFLTKNKITSYYRWKKLLNTYRTPEWYVDIKYFKT